MAAHAKWFGPSKAHQWLHCTASVALCNTLPAQVSGPYADEGTAAHSLCEWCLRKSARPEDYVEQVNTAIIVKGVSWQIGQDMIDGVNLYLDTIAEIRSRLSKNHVMYIEKRLHLDWIHEDLFGTGDCVLAEPYGRVVVVDYKHGKGVAVEVEDNPQLMIYGLGALGEENTGEHDEVELVIVQPRAFHPDGPIRRQVMPVDKLYVWCTLTLREAIKKVISEQVEFLPGDYCRFCQGLKLNACPAQRQKALEAASIMFDDNIVPVAEPALPTPGLLSDEELGRLLTAVDCLGPWIDAVKADAHSRLEQGKDVSGWKLVEGRASRSWLNPVVAEEVLATVGVPHIDLYTREFKSVAQMEKTLKTLGMEHDLSPLIGIKRGRSLAPAADKRPAAIPLRDAKLLFD